MKQLDKKLAALGSFIEATRRQMGISPDLLCSAVQCSKSTFYSV